MKDDKSAERMIGFIQAELVNILGKFVGESQSTVDPDVIRKLFRETAISALHGIAGKIKFGEDGDIDIDTSASTKEVIESGFLKYSIVPLTPAGELFLKPLRKSIK